MANVAGPPASKFHLYTVPEIEQLPPARWLLEDLIPAESFVLLFGPPSDGKTFSRWTGHSAFLKERIGKTDWSSARRLSTSPPKVGWASKNALPRGRKRTMSQLTAERFLCWTQCN